MNLNYEYDYFKHALKNKKIKKISLAKGITLIYLSVV